MNQKLLAVISTFVALLAATHVHAQSKNLTRLRVSYSSIGAASWSTWVAKDVGIFQKFGLDVGSIYIGGGPRAMSTTIANETQITQGAGTGSILAKLAGADDLLLVATDVSKNPSILWSKCLVAAQTEHRVLPTESNEALDPS